MVDESITITIDGKEVSTSRDKTVLQAALDAGIYIPYLCYYPGMKPFGACRMCVVEVEGGRGTPASCTTPVAPDMVVHSNTSQVQDIRHGIMELLISEHPHGCLTCHRVELCGPEDVCLRHVSVNDRCVTCPKNERCELKDTTRYVGVSLNTPFTYNNRQLPVEVDDPFYDRDYNLCIVCGRCVRVCEEVRGDNAITFVERAGKALVGTSQGTSLLQSGCEFCGACLDVCPVGALVERDSKWAKAEQRITTTCTFCSVGCQVKLEVDRRGKVIRSIGEPEAAANQGQLCFKGKFGMGFINHKSRLRRPLVRREGTLEEATWEEAIQLIAQKLAPYKADGFAAIASSQRTNEELYLLQKFARTVMGTNNVDHASNTRPELVTGLADTLGYAAGTNPIWDLEHSGCILVISANLTEEHNVLGVPIKRAVQSGSKLIVIDQREVELTRYATLWLRPRPGSELMLLGFMLRVIVDEVLEDLDFVREHCENREALQHALARHFDLERVEEITGIAREQVQEAARLYARTDPAAIVYALDTVPQEHALAVTHAIADLALLTGNLGKPGTGVYPLRQGTNEQGAWDVGCLPDLLPGYRLVQDESARQELAQLWGASPPQDAGLGVRDLVDAARQGRVKAMLVLGDDGLPEDAAQGLEFLVVHDTFLGGLAQLADVVLPAVTFAEQSGTYTNLERRIQALRPALEVKDSQAMPGWWVLRELGQALGAPSFNYDSPESVLEEIAQVVSMYRGISYRRLIGQGHLQPATFPGYPIPQQFYPTSDGTTGAGIQWPIAEESDTPVLYSQGFPQGKARLAEVTPLESPSWTTPEFPLLFALGRVLHQPDREVEVEQVPVGIAAPSAGSRLTVINQQDVKVQNRIRRQELLEVHPRDARAHGLSAGDPVQVVTAQGLQLEAIVEVTERTQPGMVAAATLFGELASQLQASQDSDPMSRVPTLPLRPARVEKLTQ